MKDLEDAVVSQAREEDLVGSAALAHAAGEEDSLAREVPHYLACRRGATKCLEDQPDGGLDVLVRIEHETPACVVDESQRRIHPELPSPRLVELPTEEPGTQHMQLGLAHRALQAEQQTVIEVARIVEAILVKDERLSQRTDLEEAMPVSGVTGQARDFEACPRSGWNG